MNEGEPKQEDQIAEIKHMIMIAQQEIDREYNESTNSWPMCAADHLAVIQNFIELAHEDGAFEKEAFVRIWDNLATAKTLLQEMRKTYPNKNGPQPSDVEKQSMIESLDVFRE